MKVEKLRTSQGIGQGRGKKSSWWKERTRYGVKEKKSQKQGVEPRAEQKYSGRSEKKKSGGGGIVTGQGKLGEGSKGSSLE